MFFFFMDPDEMPTFSPALGRLEMALDTLRAVEPGMPVSEAASLVYVARRLPLLAGGSMKLRDIADEMVLPYSSFLRYTDGLSEGSKGTRKLGLLEKGLHPTDKRARQMRLTEQGLKLLRMLDDTVAGREEANAQLADQHG